MENLGKNNGEEQVNEAAKQWEELQEDSAPQSEIEDVAANVSTSAEIPQEAEEERHQVLMPWGEVTYMTDAEEAEWNRAKHEEAAN